MGNFLSDLSRSQEAVELLTKYFVSLGCSVRELPREEQKNGDLEITNGDRKYNVEVKFDIMAKRTGKLCFEMSNGMRNTGVMETKADEILYVVPNDKVSKSVFVFVPEELKQYLGDSPKVKIKNGGDKGKFVLALVKMSDVLGDGLQKDFFILKD